jgi:hypothetical protein
MFQLGHIFMLRKGSSHGVGIVLQLGTGACAHVAIPSKQHNTLWTCSCPYKFRIIEALCAAIMIHDPSTGLCPWVSVSTIVGSWSLSIKRPMRWHVLKGKLWPNYGLPVWTRLPWCPYVIFMLNPKTCNLELTHKVSTRRRLFRRRFCYRPHPLETKETTNTKPNFQPQYHIFRSWYWQIPCPFHQKPPQCTSSFPASDGFGGFKLGLT